MDRQPGASITLSFALVGVFAIILYQPEHAPFPHKGEDIAVGNAEHPPPPPDPPPPMPPPTAAEPLTAEPAPAPAPAAAVILAGAGPNRPSSRPPVMRPAQEGFTQALEGETLHDVALRVYGSADETEALWRLNRDLVSGREATLSAGTLLRTP
jgi:hypothetical protein